MEHLLHLSKDKKFKKIIDQQQPYTLERLDNYCLQLCYSIMSQQLSIKVAAVFHRRFLELYNGKAPTPKLIIITPFDKLRAIGLSNAKANYVLNVATFFVEEKLTDAKLDKMTNEELIGYLSQIKGVGQWTVEMMLMFSLGREDVFALDDLGIQQAMCKLYKIDVTDKKLMKASMVKISEKWSPYRTYACRYLWGWKDNATKAKNDAVKETKKTEKKKS